MLGLFIFLVLVFDAVLELNKFQMLAAISYSSKNLSGSRYLASPFYLLVLLVSLKRGQSVAKV
jgi:hypothetical protein